MRHVLLTTLMLLLSLLLGVCPAKADGIRLKNGDLISGEIVRLEGESITVKTSYAGEIRVKWQEVNCVSTERELTFILKTKELLKGQAICPDDGQIQIVSEKIGRTEELPLDDLEGIYLKPPPSVKYSGSITAGGSLNQGNTERASFNSAARFFATGERNRLFLEGRFNYGESSNVRDEQNWLARGKYDLFFEKKWYAYVNTLLESDDFQDLNLRTTAGLGVGHQFFDTERTKLFVEVGPSYVNEDFAEADDNDYAAARGSIGFEFDIVPKKIRFFHLSEAYYSLTESDTWFLLTEQGLRFTLVGSLFANLEFDYDYNNKPAPGNEKSDYAYIIGLGYDFDF